MSEINPQPYVAPGSLTADTAAPFDKKQRDTLPSMERPPSVLPLPRLRPPLASQDERRQVVQDFGGIVEDVDWKSGSFNARLIDLTAGDHIAYIMAEFPIDDIRSDDKDLVTEGAVFRVRVMYLIKPGGTRRRFTEIIFRRLPSWRGRNFEIAEQLASDLSAYFENST